MPQAYLCIGCGRTVDEVVGSRCISCSRVHERERKKKYGDRTGKSKARGEHQRFITSTAWRKVSKHVIARDGACTRCGATQQLTAHHVVPVRTDPSMALDPDNCVTLCRRCHGIVEGGRP